MSRDWWSNQNTIETKDKSPSIQRLMGLGFEQFDRPMSCDSFCNFHMYEMVQTLYNR